MKPDVVVLGAGLGGLCAAARLSLDGFSVLVVERHDRPGGYATTFERGRFTFEVSLHLIDAVGEGQPNRRLLDDLGVHGLDFVRPPSLRREIWPDLDWRIPHGIDPFLDLVGKEFPRELQGAKRLAALARRVNEASWANESDGALHPLGELARSTAGKVVDAHVHDPRLRRSFDLFASGWLGLPLDELAALQFLIPWYSYQAYGGYYLRGGSGALSNALADVVRGRGGSVLMNTGASKIITRHERVVGVELSDGRCIETHTVVSNINPRDTFGMITEPQPVASWNARMSAMTRSVSCVKVWLGLSRRPDTDPSDYDVYIAGRESEGVLGRRALSVICPHDWLGGESTMAISTLVPSGTEVTRAAAERLVDEVEGRLAPRLRECVEVLDVATPRTFEKFTGNPGGSIYGFNPTPRQYATRRSPGATPIDGLFLAGAWTSPGGGFSAVMRSGTQAALAVRGRS